LADPFLLVFGGGSVSGTGEARLRGKIGADRDVAEGGA